MPWIAHGKGRVSSVSHNVRCKVDLPLIRELLTDEQYAELLRRMGAWRHESDENDGARLNLPQAGRCFVNLLGRTLIRTDSPGGLYA